MPKVSVDSAIRSWPHLLGCSTSKIKLMVEEIGKLGVGNKKLGQAISKSPQILLRKPQEFIEVGISHFFVQVHHICIMFSFFRVVGVVSSLCPI